MLLMILGADRNSFQTYGDMHSLGYLCLYGGDFNCIDSLELDKARGDAQAGDKGSVELRDFSD